MYKAKQAWQLCQDPTIHLCFQFSALSKCESISPLDDLAFDMYQDPEVAHIIRLLDQKKQDTLRQGNSERSKNLKQAIADLQKVASPPQAEAQVVVLHDTRRGTQFRCSRGSVVLTLKTSARSVCVSHAFKLTWEKMN